MEGSRARHPLARPADWVDLHDAVRRILDAVEPLPAEPVALGAADGLTLAEDVIAPIDHPPWDNSAMDGYAVRAPDVRGAREDSPVRLRIVEAVAAGGFPERVVGAGEAIRVMTGAPVPEGCDGVIRLEHTRLVDGSTVEVLADSDAGRNIRPKAEDVRAGELLFRAGHRLRAAEIGVLASIGEARPRVHGRPRVALLATGDELVGIEEFDRVRAGRSIVNSNSWGLAAAARAVGADPIDLGIARDDEADVAARIAGGLDADALVTTAGASVGDHDVVKDALERAGMRLAFWRVTMRPGSPASFGSIPRSGRSPLPVFGLPGNPVSALVTFELLVKPALRRMLGRRDVYGRTVRVRTGERIRSTPQLTHFLRITLEASGQGLPIARLTGAQGSGILTSVARADALLVVPRGCDALDAGDEAVALLLPPSDQGQLDAGFSTATL